MRVRCRNQSEADIVGFIEKLHRNSIIEVGTSSLNAEIGLPQGSVLSPVLFNVYLEEALNSSEMPNVMHKRGDLLAFADDMLVMSSKKAEIEHEISELASLQRMYNLRLNKKRSEILKAEKED